MAIARWRQRRYLNDLTRLFASGQIDEALRRAIPFGGEDGPEASGTPRSRKNLSITPYRPGGAGIVNLDPGLRAELTQRYRNSVAELEKEGRILDAVFVLADLLDATPEACSYLERHGEFRLAAELSEARTQNHPETVRLWWKAGDRQRAITIAHRNGCFAPAVSRAERAGDTDNAQQLRRAWMSHLLDSGDVVGAYDAGDKLEGQEVAAIRKRLIDLGLESGGELRIRMLARQLRAGADEPHADLRQLTNDPASSHDREILVTELTKSTDGLDHPETARDLTRALLSYDAGVDRQLVEKTAALADDAVLRADLPPLTRLPKASPEPGEPLRIEIDSSDTGQVGIRDARLLSSGLVAAALETASIRLFKPNGRTAMEFDHAADVLIPADSGTHLLALRILEQNRVSITRIDTVDRTTRHLGEIVATAWASTYDGASWFLADNTQLWMLDMLAEGPSALWQQGDLGGSVLAMARDKSRLAIAVPLAEPDPLTFETRVVVRRFELPGLDVSGGSNAVLTPASTLCPDGRVLAGEAAGSGYQIHRTGSDDDRQVLAAIPEDSSDPAVTIQIDDPSTVRSHVDGSSLLVFDSRGRIEIVDLERGLTRRSHRVVI